MTRKETFEWLDRYRLAKKAETEIELEIEMLENEYMIPAKRMDGMPRGSGGKDLASFAAPAAKVKAAPDPGRDHAGDRDGADHGPREGNAAIPLYFIF